MTRFITRGHYKMKNKAPASFELFPIQVWLYSKFHPNVMIFGINERAYIFYAFRALELPIKKRWCGWGAEILQGIAPAPLSIPQFELLRLPSWIWNAKIYFSSAFFISNLRKYQNYIYYVKYLNIFLKRKKLYLTHFLLNT